MAGRKGRSGRRRIAPTSPKLKLPVLGDSYESVRRYIAAINRAVAGGQLDHTKGRELVNGANVFRRALADEKREGELPELRKMLEQAKAIRKAGQAHAADVRQRRTPTTTH